MPLAAADAESVRVERPLNGDSLLLTDGRQVRLIGINAPEFHKDGEPHAPLAAAARQRASVLTRGQNVRLVYDIERLDRYKRTLAYVVLPDGRDLQTVLVGEGLAWFVAIPPNVARVSAYQAAEAEARAERRGVWSSTAYDPIPAERLAPGRTGFLRVTGTVRSVRFSGANVMLGLAPNGFLVVPRNAGELTQIARSLTGKRVLARGWLTAYKSEMRMRLAHPAMLEVWP